MREKATRILSFFLSLALASWLGWLFFEQWDNLGRFDFAPDIRFVALGGILLIPLFYFPYFHAWRRILLSISPGVKDQSKRDLLIIFFKSFVLRYLPAGKLVNVGTRVELLHRDGALSRSVGMASVLIEQYYLMLGAILFAWIGAATNPFHLSVFPDGGWPIVFLAGLILLSLLGFLPYLLSSLGITRRWQIGVLNALQKISPRMNGELLLRYLLLNVVQGVIAAITLRAVVPSMPETASGLMVVIASYPIGRLAGQLSTLFPGGIGIREAVYATILSAYFPVSQALIGASLMRVVSMLCEGTIVIALISSRRIHAIGKRQRPIIR